MLPQPQLPRMTLAKPPRTLAKPPKAPLRGQGPSGAPTPAPAQDANIKAVAMQQAQAQTAQQPRYQAPAAQAPRYQAPPQAVQQAPQPVAVQQPRVASVAPPPVAQAQAVDPRAQAIDALRQQTAGSYPNPEWQPGPSFLKTTEPFAPQTGGLVAPTSVTPQPRYDAPDPTAAPVELPLSAVNTTPIREAPAGGFVPTTPVDMNPRYDPTAPHSGAPDPTIGADGQTIEPRPLAPENTTPLRTGEPSGPNPTDDFDWEALADELGISGLQDQVKETTAKEALGAMTKPLSEYGFNPEELQAQEDQIIRAAAEAKAKLGQQMAGRGLGGSGLEVAGLGNVDVGAISAMTDLQTENKALQIEQRLNEIKTYLSAYGSQLDDETRNNLAAEAMDLQREQMANAKTDQEEADRHTLLNNAIAQVGADKWDPEALAWAYDQLDAGADIQDILRDLGVSSTGGAGGSSVYQQGGGDAGSGEPMAVTSGDGPIPAGFAQPSGAIAFVPDENPNSPMPVEAIRAAYDAYMESASQSGTPALNYGDWVYWNVLNSGTPPNLWSQAMEHAGA